MSIHPFIDKFKIYDAIIEVVLSFPANILYKYIDSPGVAVSSLGISLKYSIPL